MVGDLKYGRTVHSLSQLASLYDNTLVFIAPQSLQVPTWVKDRLTIPHRETEDLHSELPKCDVLYVTRIQQERFADPAEYQRYKGVYQITPDLLKAAKEKMVLMHPLPRVDEITPEVDADPRAAYFRQVNNGMFIRMALLSLVLGE
jgi:aspartate carbamoyltransferase catalytic subunit